MDTLELTRKATALRIVRPELLEGKELIFIRFADNSADAFKQDFGQVIFDKNVLFYVPMSGKFASSIRFPLYCRPVR